MRGSAVIEALPGANYQDYENGARFDSALKRHLIMGAQRARLQQFNVGDSWGRLGGERPRGQVINLAEYRESLRRSRMDANARAICDTVNKYRSGQRRDAFSPNAGFHLARQLEYIHKTVLEEPFPQYNAMRLFPVDSSVPPGATSWTLTRVYYHGEAKVHRGGVNNARAGVTQREQTFPIRHLVSSYMWDIFEAASSQFANSGLLTKLARGARDAIMELQNYLYWFGSKVHGLYGILTYPWLPKKVITTPWTDAQAASDADAILASLNAFTDFPGQNSQGVFGPTKLVTTKRVRDFLMKTPRSGNVDTTIGQHFLDTDGNINEIEVAWELEDLGGAGIDGIFAYRDDQRGVMLVMPQGITNLPVQALGFDNTVHSYCSIGGVAMPDVGNNVLGFVQTNFA